MAGQNSARKKPDDSSRQVGIDRSLPLFPGRKVYGI